MSTFGSEHELTPFNFFERRLDNGFETFKRTCEKSI